MNRCKRILIVDDEISNRELLEALLTGFGHEVELAANGSEALAKLDRTHDLVLLDVMMPGMDGFEVARLIRKQSAVTEIPICMVTALSDMDQRLRAVEAGANDFIAKPIDKTELKIRTTAMLKTKEAQDAVRDYRVDLEAQNLILDDIVQERTRELEDARLEILIRLARAAEYRDDNTGQHTQRVGRMAGLLGEEVGLNEKECKILALAGPLHDVGKIGISDTILLKPGKLTSEEFAVMNTHTSIGAKILDGSRVPVLLKAEELALTHHEKWDGSGYPAGLVGDNIPLSGRIVAVVDVFDALSNDRPYRKAWPKHLVISHLREGSGKHFDPDLVEPFVNMMSA